MRSAWLLLFAVPALAQPPCTVQTEERLTNATARFSLGPTTVALTLPVGFRVEFLTFYLEVKDPKPDLFLQSGSQKIAVRDGAAFSLEPEIDDRPTFSITGREGRRLCSWQPSERVWAYDPPQILAPPRRLHRLMPNAVPQFFLAGDPILLETRSKTARDFTIDGEPATVLARTTRQVILRDPNPSAGFRTVKSQRYEAVLAMVQAQRQLAGGVLQIKVTGPEVLTGEAAVTVFNLNRGVVELHCGSAVHHHDWPEAARLPLSGDDKGVFTGVCPVKLRAEGEPQFDLVLQEQKMRPGQQFTTPQPYPTNRPPVPRRKIDTAATSMLEAQHG